MLRVIAGKAKGRRLKQVPGDSTRPIMDRVKEALFSIVQNELAESVWLDLFGGTGSVGIEALSRGAKHVTFVDNNRNALQTIRANLAVTGFESQAQVHAGDAFKFLQNTPQSYDFIYIAPPQYKGLWVTALQLCDACPALLNANGQVVVQIDPKEQAEINLSRLVLVDARKYGQTRLSFYQFQAQSPA
ncbi:MAG TPA: 16S rRNA (guanine(966)-N(2))-methyltransferase RsmD [Anaerolineales bacterium]|nr:16S rRNA (guanine(966)-N(2))-methyltransferase RsmD [Anaerolineales bacterium]